MNIFDDKNINNNNKQDEIKKQPENEVKTEIQPDKPKVDAEEFDAFKRNFLEIYNMFKNSTLKEPNKKNYKKEKKNK